MKEQYINIWTGREAALGSVKTVQGDSGRILKCVLQDLTVPEGATARIFALKPSGKKVYNDCEVDGNTVSVKLTTQMLAEPGRTEYQIEVLSGEESVTSFSCFLDVRKQLADDDAVLSMDESSVLDRYANDAKQAAKKAESEAGKADASARDSASSADRAAGSAADADGSAKAAEKSDQSAAQHEQAARDAADRTKQAIESASPLLERLDEKKSELEQTIGEASSENTKLEESIAKAGDMKEQVDDAVQEALGAINAESLGNLLYPVGSIYMSVNAVDPGTIFGGTWERIKDTFLLASSETYGAGTTGGSADAALPEHTHAVTASSAEAGAHTHTTSGTAASAGAHTHGLSGTAVSNGAHTHSLSGTAASAGAHIHSMGKIFSNGSGSGSAYVLSSNRTVNTRNTASAGAHTHGISGTAASSGAHTHNLSGTAASAGAHTHTVSGTAASAGGHAHTVTATADKVGVASAGKNMPPYLAVYVWKRTA